MSKDIPQVGPLRRGRIIFAFENPPSIEVPATSTFVQAARAGGYRPRPKIVRWLWLNVAVACSGAQGTSCSWPPSPVPEFLRDRYRPLATAVENRLSFRCNQHNRLRQPALAEAIAFYEYTPHMEHVLLIVCATGILLYFLWKVDLHRERNLKLLSNEYAKTRLSDEAVIKAQTEFERRLETNIDLPDGIRRKDAFIYLHHA
jgi:hypothetical protein